MSLYSAIQFTSVSFLYASASNLGDFQVRSNPRLSTLGAYLLIDVNIGIVLVHRLTFDTSDSYFQYVPHVYCAAAADILPVGWTGAFPVLSRKRPTASLVSRKVLTPLLGQVTICIVVQLIGFETVRRQSW